jgi:hypothetical protein
MTLAIALVCAVALMGRSAVAGPDGVDISQSGSGLTVTLINPPDGAASLTRNYATEKAGCNNGPTPCYVFAGINGTAPLPVTTSVCTVVNDASVPTAYCAAAGISSITLVAVKGGTIGYDASGDSEMGKNCFPAALTYRAGGGVFSVLAHDGCKQTIVCTDASTGTVDADASDAIENCTKAFVQRH